MGEGFQMLGVKTTAITKQISSIISSCLENDIFKEKYLESM